MRPKNGLMKADPMSESTIPNTTAERKMNVNNRFARLPSPSPMIFATSAAPPVPSM